MKEEVLGNFLKPVDGMCLILLPVVFKFVLAVGCKKSKMALMLK